MQPGLEQLKGTLKAQLAAGAMLWKLQPRSVQWAALALLLLGLALQASVRPWLQQQARQTAAALTPQTPMGPDHVPDGRSASAARVWDSLPTSPGLSADLDRLVATSQRLNLSLPRAQMRRIEAPAPLLIEEVDLELQAPYATIRRYVARTLNELPHASLRRIRLERTTDDASGGAPLGGAGGSIVRATLTLRLHYRAKEHAS